MRHTFTYNIYHQEIKSIIVYHFTDDLVYIKEMSFGRFYTNKTIKYFNKLNYFKFSQSIIMLQRNYKHCAGIQTK